MTDSIEDKRNDMRWKQLLKREKTIRDPVHGDVWLTDLEVKVIDTEEFQRLRFHRQLGPCYLVFPGAEHSRFQHALGTLYVAQRLISAVNLNTGMPDLSKAIKNRERVLIRLCSLLHDFVNISFGHTLENEGGLIERDWKDKRRVDHLLTENRAMGKLIISYIDEKVGSGKGAEFFKELKQVLTASDEAEIETLPHPYVADIVSNTICADLLDYLKRDRYFTGLKEDYDLDRILNYVVIADYQSEENRERNETTKRMAIRLWTEKQRMKRDILSELIDLLRLRYSLAEKVYFHHAKMAGSAMLIRAIDDSNILQGPIPELLKYGDDQLLNLKSNAQSTTDILQCYRKRALYKPVYQISYVKRGAGANLPEKVRRVAIKFHQRSERRSLEQRLEGLDSLKALGTKKGDIIVYCPDIDMNMKVATVKVFWQDSKVYPLKNIPDRDIRDEVESIEEKHQQLWKMLVLLNRFMFELAAAEGALGFISSLCESEFGLSNELPYKLTPLAQKVIQQDSPVQRLKNLERVRQYAVANPSKQVKDDEMVEVVETIATKAARDAKSADLTDTQIDEILSDLRKSRQSKLPS